MKNHSTPAPFRWLALSASGIALANGALHAAPFLYRPGDLVLTFRQSGNASDYVVNLGRATNYNSLATGASLTVTNVDPSQLNAAFPTLDGVNWLVGGANRPPGDPSFPLQTLWVTAPRPDPNQQSTPWLRKGQFLQGNVGSQIDGIGFNAAQSSSLLPGGLNNTATGVVIPVSAPYAIGPVIGTDGNYFGQFQGKVENLTPDDFRGQSSAVSRSDLYELLPGTSAAGTLDAPGRYLGYFELKPDGSVTFNNKVGEIGRPTIAGITRHEDKVAITCSSVAGAVYRVRSTDAAGLTTALSNWSTGSSTTGDGGVVTLHESKTTEARFYVIEVQP